MPAYIFSCPICKKKYKVTPNDPSVLKQKSFTCPTCRYQAPFVQLIKELQQVPPPPPNVMPQAVTQGDNPSVVPPPVPPVPGGGHTKVAQQRPAEAKAHLNVLNTGAKFVLNPGFYVLGRKSSDSPATLQLAPDISMSRQHARLAVQLVNGVLRAQIAGLKASNPVVVNGKALAPGQSYTLKPGDRLQLGSTQILFSK